MARIRTIKPGFFKDGDLYDAELASGLPLRVAYAGLWCIADREGRFEWKPREIKTDVLPYDSVDMAKVMDALSACGKLLKYRCNGNVYGLIPKFKKHQYVNKNEAQSTIPAPDNDGECTTQEPEAHPQFKEQYREQEKVVSASADPHPENGAGKPRAARAAYPEQFEMFWKAYPTDKLMSKKQAASAWVRLSPEDRIAAVASVPEFRAFCAKDKTYRPVHAVRYLSERRFDGFTPQTVDPEIAEALRDKADRLMRRGKYAEN